MKINWQDCSDRSLQRGISLMRAINKCGYQAYLVGGCVRDLVLWYNTKQGKGDPQIHDVDLATNMPIDKLKATFKTHDNGGEEHGTILVFWEGEPFEVTQFRVDGNYSDGRHADSVSYTNSFEEDTKRRDFTINAMGIDADGNVIDYHGGVDDLKQGIIRTVGNAGERFSEDGLRIMRAMRFAAKFKMQIAEDTLNGINENRTKLDNIAMERVHDEFKKTAQCGANAFAQVVELLSSTGCCDIIDPKGLIDWNSAVELTAKHAENILIPELNCNPVMSFAYLFYTTYDDNFEQAARYFRCTVDDLKTFKYIYGNYGTYVSLVTGQDVDIVACINMVNNSKDFSKVQEFAFTLRGVKPNQTVNDYVRVGKIAAPRAKELTAALQNAGVATGPQFGVKLRELQSWFYKQYLDRQDGPSTEEITQFIQANLL